MTICYHYSATTGEYLSSSELRPSPLEPGKYLLPANATLIPAPETESGSIACWNGSSWIVHRDLRGKIYWDKESQNSYLITDLSTIPQENWTDIEPHDPSAIWTGSSWEIPLAILKERKISQVRTQVDLLLREIQKNFSDTEFISWSKQEAGARALMDDPETQHKDADFVRAMAQARGISIDEQVAKIMNHITPYTTIMAQMLGEQQRREDIINATTSIEELDAIHFDSPLT